jgi:fatty-acyl-CoA synthase
LTKLHLATVWESVADAIPGETALIQGQGHLTWRELDERAARLAAGLRAAGLGHGSRLAIDMFNSSEFIETFFAAVKIGAVVANVNYRYAGSELTYLLDDLEAEAVVFHAGLADAVLAVAPAVKTLRTLVQADFPGTTSRYPKGSSPTRV